MKYQEVFLICGAGLLLSGCASLISAKTAEWPWPSDATLCKGDKCTETEALNAFMQASNFCRNVQNYYESGGQRSNALKVGVGAVGAVAGGVIAPIANGSASTAWSGLSGATNALQISIDEAFSSTVLIKRRASVTNAADTGANLYSKEETTDNKVVAAVNMARSCAMSSAIADESVIRSISQGSVEPQNESPHE